MITELTPNPINSQISNQQPSNVQIDRLLLCCIRYQFKTATTSEITDLLQTNLNWDILLHKALKHNVFMLLSNTLKQTHLESIPSSVFEKMQKESQKRITYSLFRTHKLFQILDLLAANNIQALSFKGPTWATLAYGNIGLRDFSDVDILVRSQDFPIAKELLIEQGYYDKNFGRHEEQVQQVQMVLPDSPVNIDLHYSLVPKDFYLDIKSEAFFDRLQTVSILGKPVTTFSPENSIAIAYMNGAKENWKALKRICDFGALIQTYPEANWQEIITQCGTDENDRAFWLGIAIAQTYLQISLPERLSEKLKQFPEVLELAKQHQQFFCDYQELEGRYVFRIFSFLEKKEMSLGDKVQYFLKIVLQINEKDREHFSLPPFLFFLYYPLRIVRLIKTYNLNQEKLSLLFNIFRY